MTPSQEPLHGNDEQEDVPTAVRFATSSKACFEAYEAWDGDQLSSEKRDLLRKAMHTMRKVVARVEIEMALSESKERAKNPMPVPRHKTQSKKNDGAPLDVSDEVKDRIRTRKKEEAEEREINKQNRAKRKNEKQAEKAEKPEDDNALPGFLTPSAEGKEEKPARSSQRRPRRAPAKKKETGEE